MEWDALKASKKEAVRFLERVWELENNIGRKPHENQIRGCSESGAVRRASMDLTRALARLRS